MSAHRTVTDLLQFVQSGRQLDDGPIVWDELGQHQYIVPAANRRRILDREHDRGVTPGDDGWLTTSRDLGPLHLTDDEQAVAGYDHDPTLTVWQRIRWEPLGPTDIHNLDDRST